MKIYDYNLFKQSLVNDIKKKNKISFLFGSAISYPDSSGKGIPSVKDIINIIIEYLKENEMFEGYTEYTQNVNDADKYQKSFEFVSSVGDQNDIIKIMQRIMSHSKDEYNNWVIPKTIKNLAKLIINSHFEIQSIITTNFDPLIEESLKKSNLNVHPIILTKDMSIEENSSYNQKSINIIHLHGFHTGDTMHTPNQLLSSRDKLKSSLKNIMENSKLYVIGYGGWEDIFNKSLCEIMEQSKANYDIRWAFYENDENIIKNKNVELIKTLTPAISSSRFNAYKGVDCSKLFNDICEKFNFIASESKNNEIEIKSNRTQIIPIKEVISRQTKDISIAVKPYPLSIGTSHKRIRIMAQISAKKFLENEGSFILKDSGGLGKQGFIYSIVDGQNYKGNIFRVDLSLIKDKEKAEAKLIQDIGVDITALINDAVKKKEEKHLVIIDNISSPSIELTLYLKSLIGIFKDYSKDIQGIFVSQQKLELSENVIELKPLDQSDIKEYLIDLGSNNEILQPNNIEKIFNKTDGIIVKLDELKEKLKYTSLSHILDEECLNNKNNQQLAENIPKHLLELLEEFSNTENEEKKRQYFLLKILSILECGENAETICNHYSTKKFKIRDFMRLCKIELAEVIKVKLHFNQSITIIKISPFIKDYIKNEITPNEQKEIIKPAVIISLGNIWKNKRVTPSFDFLDRLNHSTQQPGNPHLLLVLLLSKENDLKQKQFIKNMCISYCIYLNRLDRYKELISFTSDILNFFDKSELNYYKINNYLASANRMLGQHTESIDIIKKISEDFKKDEKIFNKSTYEKMLSTLLLAYKSNRDDEAYTLAKKLKNDYPKNSYLSLLSETILISKKPINIKFNKLKYLEKKARKIKELTIANNISLDIVDLSSNSKEKGQYIAKVLNSNESTYTRIRALLRKLKNSSNYNITEDDEKSLISAYQYLFIQRLDKLFDQSHSLLWNVFVKKNDFSKLYDIYRTSSFIWRINDKIEIEKKCLTSLNEMLKNVNIEDTNIKSIQQFIEQRLQNIQITCCDLSLNIS